MASPLQRTRWLRRLCWLLVPAALIAFPWWAPWIAAPLVCRATPRDAPAEFVAPLGGDRRLEAAARSVRTGEARRVLLIRMPPSRLQDYGITGDPAAGTFQALVEFGTPPEAIVIDEPRGEEDLQLRPEQRLVRRLQTAPGQKVIVLCAEFSSRWTAWRLASAPEGTVAIQPLRDRRYALGGWWNSREGVKAVLYGYFDLAWFACAGPTPLPPQSFDEDTFEKRLRALPQAPTRSNDSAAPRT